MFFAIHQTDHEKKHSCALSLSLSVLHAVITVIPTLWCDMQNFPTFLHLNSTCGRGFFKLDLGENAAAKHAV